MTTHLVQVPTEHVVVLQPGQQGGESPRALIWTGRDEGADVANEILREDCSQGIGSG